jgi:16S rRNA (cytosine967-C5)-methyltransferase
MPTPRQTALRILQRVDSDDVYSNIELDSELGRLGLGGRDAAFVTALVYGVLESRIRLDYILSHYLRRSGAQLRPNVRGALRLGAYQILYMDRVPQRSAVNESVELVKSSGSPYAAGFVNAVLRAVAADAQAGSLPEPDKDKEPLKYLSVRYSCPEWLITMWEKAYGSQKTLAMLPELAGRPPVCARVNTLRTEPGALAQRLSGLGEDVKVSGMLPDALEFGSLPDLRRLAEFKDGLFFIEDLASQLCCRAVSPRPGDRVIDMCAAPGGKSFTLALMMGGRGSVTACELYESRLGLIKEGARRLGLDGTVTAVRNDSSRRSAGLGEAERVLCDVPCSGLGAIRRKPEIRYKAPETFDLLPDLQYSILCEGSRHVAPGGRLVYSTCTLRPEENEGVAGRFLRENPDFEDITPDADPVGVCPEPGHFITLFPGGGTDGFFFAVFSRRGA